MNIQNNRNKRTNIFKTVVLYLMVAVLFTLISCDDDIDIQQSYPSTMKTVPVPSRVIKEQTVEIRCKPKKEGNFAGTLHTIRCFQFEGGDSLKMDNGIILLPNNRYLLENEKLRLYYAAEGDETHNFIMVVEGSLKSSYESELDSNDRNVRDDGLIAISIGNFRPSLK